MLKALLTQELYDKLPEAEQSYYKEIEGKFVLQVQTVDGLELAEVTKMRKALQTERSDSEKAKQQLKVFEGIDPEAARDALLKVKEMDNWDPDKKLEEGRKQLEAKFAEDKAKLEKSFTGKLEVANKNNEVISFQLQETMINSAATMAIAEAKGSVELLLPIVKSKTRMRQLEDGRFVAEVLDEDGTARLSPTAGSTAQMTISELVGELRSDEKFARAFDSSGASGSGAEGSELTSSSGHKISASDALDTQKYQTAKEAAIKAGKELTIVGAS